MAKASKKSIGKKSVRSTSSRTQRTTRARKSVTKQSAKPVKTLSRSIPIPPAEIELIARGCLTDHGRVLLCQNLKHGYYYLPGGHIEITESASVALAREFLEEAGVKVFVHELGLVTENVFTTGKKTHHEINLVFHVELATAATNSSAGPRKAIKSLEPHIAFRWMDIAQLVEADLRPDSAKAWLLSLDPMNRSGAQWCSECPQ